MKKSNLYLLGIALLFAFALPAFGQDDTIGGCIDSPENPTAILGVVGSAGVLFMSVRARIKARRSSSK